MSASDGYRDTRLTGLSRQGLIDSAQRSRIVEGNGVGGIYHHRSRRPRLWDPLFAGKIISLETVAEMTRPRSDVPEMSMHYGLGFWRDDSTGAVSLLGIDAGVGFVSTHHPDRRITTTVLCNQTRGAWPTSQLLAPST